MQKIMFTKGLTRAVLEGYKTKTRRFAKKVLVEDEDGNLKWNGEFEKPRYKVGEVVAVAQSYKELLEECGGTSVSPLVAKAGYMNKMFVRADLMLHQIRFTAECLERLQDISDEDCLKEGIIEYAPCCECGSELYAFDGADDFWYTPREAFAALIDNVSGKGTWNSNPWVYVYEFEKVK